MRARDNPFRTERIGRLRFRHREASGCALRARFDALGGRGAIVGPHGSGKTTLLRELGEALAGEGMHVVHWFLDAEARRPALARLLREARALGPRDVLLFDGADHLPRPYWLALRAASGRARGIAITSHAEGLAPTLLQTSTDAALLAELTRELVGPAAAPIAPLLDALRREHDGNLREVFLALYDLVANDDPRVRAIGAAVEPASGAQLAP